MKKKLLLCLSSLCALLLLISAFSVTASAVVTSGTCGGNNRNPVKWSYNNGTLTVNGGLSYNPMAMMDYSATDTTPWAHLAEDIVSVIVEGDVTTVGKYAFADLPNLTTVTLGKRVNKISDYAFRGCEALTTIIFQESSKLTAVGVAAFEGCISLEDVILPQSVTTIGQRAFEGCSALATLSLGSGVTTIGGSAFMGCSSLSVFFIPSSVKTIGDRAFSGCTSLASISIPASVKTVGSRAFDGCTSLASVTVGSGVTTIGAKAFYGAASLSSLTFSGSTLTTIDYAAFEGCVALKSVTIPASVKTIANRAFYGTSLESVTFASGSVLERIGGSAFEGCEDILTLSLPASLKQIGAKAFAGCKGLTAVTIASGSVLERIDKNAFSGCDGLYYISNGSSLTFKRDSDEYGGIAKNAKLVKNAGVTSADAGFSVDSTGVYLIESLNDGTLRLWASLSGSASLTLPNTINGRSYQPYYMRGVRNVTLTGGSYIGASAFMGASSLRSVTIPASVTYIDKYAFYGCTSLVTVTYDSASALTSIGESAFRGASSLTAISLPAGVRDIGKNAFAATTSVTSITVASGSTAYFVSGNCLIEASTGKLVLGCKNSTIPTDGSVTAIGEGAFFACDGLTSVTVPASVATIADNAFYFCQSLKSVAFAGTPSVKVIGSSAFAYCPTLTTFTVPASVTSIGACAFDTTGIEKLYVSNLKGWLAISFESESANPLSNGATLYLNGAEATSVTVPADATVINSLSLSVYDKLAALSVASGNSVYKSAGNCIIDAATNTLILGCKNSTIPSSVTAIGEGAFFGCESLSDITIPSSIVSIGKNAFYETGAYHAPSNWENGVLYLGTYLIKANDNTVYTDHTVKEGTVGIADEAFLAQDAIITVVLPKTLVWIGEKSFAFASSLENVTFAKSGALSRIDYGAFAYCSSLKSVTVPATVTSLGNGAFASCTSLKKLTIESGNPVYKNVGSGVVEIASKTLIYGQGNTVIPADGTVTSIGAYAFAGRTDLTNLTIPAGILSIGDWAFADCDKLYAVTIPATVKTIGEGAFASASSLSRVNFAENSTLLSIGNGAFAYCVSLRSATLPASLKALGANGFYGCTSLASVSFDKLGSIATIGEQAFFGCAALKTVLIPDTIEAVGENAFLGASITNVYFAGERDALASVTFANAYADPTRGATVVYAYTCTYLAHDGTVFFVDKAWEGSVAVPPRAPEREGDAQYGYAFSCWEVLEGSADATQDAIYIAKYTLYEKTYVYTFLAEDGETVLKEVTAKYGMVVIAPAAPTKAATAQYTYTFVGFEGFTEGMTLTEDVSFVAKYSATTNKYTYVFYGEDGETVLKTETVDYGTVITSPEAPVKAGNAQYSYTFQGYTGYESGMILTGNVSFTATYNRVTNQYTYIFYDEDGKTVLKAVIADYGTKIVAPKDPQKAESDLYAYTFDAWLGFEDGMTLTENVSFTAKYIAALRGVLTLESEKTDTAWGLDALILIKGKQVMGAGGSFAITLDESVALYLAHTAADGVTVTKDGERFTVTVMRAIEENETLLSLTLKPTENLAAGEHIFLSLAENDAATATFAPLCIYEMGDVNLDGKVNARDAVLIKQYVVQMVTLSEVQLAYANAYADDKINARDAVLLQQYIVKMPVTPGERHTLVFDTGDTEVRYTVKSGEDFAGIPEAPEGYVWSLSKEVYVVPVFTAIEKTTKYYLVKKT